MVRVTVYGWSLAVLFAATIVLAVVAPGISVICGAIFALVLLGGALEASGGRFGRRSPNDRC
jgi:hypothetical protein